MKYIGVLLQGGIPSDGHFHRCRKDATWFRALPGSAEFAGGRAASRLRDRIPHGEKARSGEPQCQAGIKPKAGQLTILNICRIAYNCQRAETKMLAEACISSEMNGMTFAQWREAMSRTYSLTNCFQLAAGEFVGHLENRRFGGINVGNIQSTSLCYKRGMDEIRRNPIDDFVILLMLEGTFAVAQEDAIVTATPGDLLIYHEAKPFELHIDRPYRAITFAVPQVAITSRFWKAPRVAPRVTDSTSPNGRFAASLLREFGDLSELDSVADPGRVVAAALDVFATALAHGAGSLSSEALYSDRLLESVKNYIMKHLEDPDLDFHRIAAASNVSERTLNRLFARVNSTPIRWMWSQRLNASYDAIISRKVANVTAAAFSFGFKDVSHFSRAFKKEFGVSPGYILRS
jgi:AraC-like DNA-binding protein